MIMIMITNIYQLRNTGQQFICSNQFYVYWKYKRWVLLLFILQLKNKKKKTELEEGADNPNGDMANKWPSQDSNPNLFNFRI